MIYINFKHAQKCFAVNCVVLVGVLPSAALDGQSSFFLGLFQTLFENSYLAPILSMQSNWVRLLNH